MSLLSPLNNISDFFQLFSVSFDAPNLHQLNKAYVISLSHLNYISYSTEIY